MKLWKIIFLTVFLFLGVRGLSSWAEENTVSDASNPQWQSSIERVRAETNALLKENEKLNAEYEFLQEKVNGLRVDLGKSKADVDAQVKQNQDLKNFREEQATKTPDWHGQMKSLQDDVDQLDADNKALRKKLADAEEKNRLWKIQVSNLETKKRDATLDADYSEAKSDETPSEQGSDEDAKLKAQLNDSIAQEKDLLAKINALSAKNEALPVSNAQIKKENHEMEGHLAQLKKEIAAQQQMNEKLKKQAQKSGPTANKSASADLLKEKKALQADVNRLTAQLDSVNKTVSQSQGMLKKKRQLMDQIMRLDAENQEMRAKIDAMSPPASAK